MLPTSVAPVPFFEAVSNHLHALTHPLGCECVFSRAERLLYLSMMSSQFKHRSSNTAAVCEQALWVLSFYLCVGRQQLALSAKAMKFSGLEQVVVS